ncbi:ribosome maturation factor RimP [Peptostreptococcus equinus]|uniref:Ribosome maturation factor RimP n=1 Tax=Peptostreptococcus equinus TaxID=3003601 RepID=A0ABY7JU06_9FIRM|nr:ribosome maturation factor RimP [Peptostreptococcus sp. CBA3647]WAW15638.1 ribosome maturation factor RimP [Peptostreptococcus sp. CBA3647]
MKKNTAQRVEELIKPSVDELAYELVDVEYVKEAGVYYLRVIIDSPDGIGLDECENLSRVINPILDENDFIVENYFLEVCSPGIDRVLKREKEFSKYSGKEVEVKLYKNDEELKTKHFEATLVGLDEKGNVELEYNDKKIIFDRKDIAQIRLAVKF